MKDTDNKGRKEPSDDDGLLLVEVTPDELELINRHRAVYKETVKGITYSEKPAYLETQVETPDKLIQLKYSPLTTRITDISKKRNPNKISHGKRSDGRNRLEFYSYRNSSTEKFFISVNGEYISLSKHDWNYISSVQSKIGHILGKFGNKRQINRRKKR